MKFKTVALAALFILIISFAGTAGISNAAASAQFSLITDKLDYDFAEPIIVTLRAKNTGSETLNLAFPTACQADYIIDDLAKEQTICAQVLTEISIKPGESRDWSFTNAPGQSGVPVLYPGGHNIRAVLMGYPSSEATQSITVNYADGGEGQYCGGITNIKCQGSLLCKLDLNATGSGGYCYDSSKPAPAVGTLSGAPSASKFSDVKPVHWAYVYINFLADKGLIAGYSDGTFHPDAYITRAELTKMSLAGAGIQPRTDLPDSFTDLDEWQKSWVFTAQNLNIVQGYSAEKFEPNRSITRAEALKIMLLSFGVKQADIDAAGADTQLSFTDVPTDAWYKNYVAYAYKNSILQGYPDNTFKPGYLISRAEAAKIIANLWQKKSAA